MQFGVAQGLDLRLQPEADPQRALASARALGGESDLAGFQIDRRGVAGAFDIEEKHQVLVTQRPAGDHQRLALAHPEE